MKAAGLVSARSRRTTFGRVRLDNAGGMNLPPAACRVVERGVATVVARQFARTMGPSRTSALIISRPAASAYTPVSSSNRPRWRTPCRQQSRRPPVGPTDLVTENLSASLANWANQHSKHVGGDGAADAGSPSTCVTGGQPCCGGLERFAGRGSVRKAMTTTRSSARSTRSWLVAGGLPASCARRRPGAPVPT